MSITTIYDCLKENPRQSQRQIQEGTGLSKGSVVKNLQRLMKRKDIVRVIGKESPKNGYNVYLYSIKK